MKKILSFTVYVLLTSNVLAQDGYNIPVLNSDQKHERTISQAWVIAAAGINFAKAHGVSPYEYGIYIGKLFAPTWGAGNDFNKLINGSVYNFETFRHVSDPELTVRQNSDGSVSLTASETMLHKYFPDGNPFASFSEFIEFNRGIYSPIAERMGATIDVQIKDNSLIYTFTKK